MAAFTKTTLLILNLEDTHMDRFDFNTQEALITALLTHPGNIDRSAHWALGYMVNMLAKAVRKLPPNGKDVFLADVKDVIDHSRKAREDHLAAG